MIYDAIILGGGPAGLSTALGLARQLYSVVVFDSQQYRNDPADRMHNVLSWDHKPPSDFRASARVNILSRYDTVTIRSLKIDSLVKTEEGRFEATDCHGGKTVGKTVVLAVGVADQMLDIPGFSELWGRSIFHCLVCHGYEEAGGQSAGIIAAGQVTDPQRVLHVAGMVAPLAKDIVVYSNGDADVTEKMLAATEGKRVTVESGKIVGLNRKYPGRPEVVVHLADGSTRDEAFMVAAPFTTPNGPFADQLGLSVDEQGVIQTRPPFYETDVAGVFAVGDCATPVKAVSQAMAMGSFASAGIIGRLGQEKLKL